MKRVRCPKCDSYIIFDESKYKDGQSLVFQCTQCGKQFKIKMGVSKLRETLKEENKQANDTEQQIVQSRQGENAFGTIVVIENVFHYKQLIPLQLGDNVIGRYQKGNNINTPIETVDPSVDLNHCVINVSYDKNKKLKYILRDGPSYTGTFVNNELLGPHERRVISNGTLFTIGATSIILRTTDEE